MKNVNYYEQRRFTNLSSSVSLKVHYYCTLWTIRGHSKITSHFFPVFLNPSPLSHSITPSTTPSKIMSHQSVNPLRLKALPGLPKTMKVSLSVSSVSVIAPVSVIANVACSSTITRWAKVMTDTLTAWQVNPFRWLEQVCLSFDIALSMCPELLYVYSVLMSK